MCTVVTFHTFIPVVPTQRVTLRLPHYGWLPFTHRTFAYRLLAHGYVRYYTLPFYPGLVTHHHYILPVCRLRIRFGRCPLCGWFGFTVLRTVTVAGYIYHTRWLRLYLVADSSCGCVTRLLARAVTDPPVLHTLLLQLLPQIYGDLLGPVTVWITTFTTLRYSAPRLDY